MFPRGLSSKIKNMLKIKQLLKNKWIEKIYKIVMSEYFGLILWILVLVITFLPYGNIYCSIYDFATASWSLPGGFFVVAT